MNSDMPLESLQQTDTMLQVLPFLAVFQFYLFRNFNLYISVAMKLDKYNYRQKEILKLLRSLILNLFYNMHSCRLIYHLFMAKMKIFSVLKAIIAVSSGPEVIQLFSCSAPSAETKICKCQQIVEI